MSKPLRKIQATTSTIRSDDVFPMNYAALVVMAARMRVIELSPSVVGILFSQPSQGRGPVRLPREFHPEGNPEFLEHLFIEMADQARKDWQLIPAGATARFFIQWNQDRRGEFSKRDATSSFLIEEIVFKDLPEPEPANLLRFPTAPHGQRTRSAYLGRIPLSPEIDPEWFGLDYETGCPFRADDLVKPSTVGEVAVLEKNVRTSVIRPLDANQVLVKIGGKERCCPTSWFALDIKPSAAAAVPLTVFQPDYAVGDVVQFQTSGLGLPFYPNARVLVVVPPGEDPVSLLGETLPEWRKTHRLGSAAVRLSAGANTFRYWVEADPVPESNRGPRPRPRLFLKRQDWIWKGEV